MDDKGFVSGSDFQINFKKTKKTKEKSQQVSFWNQSLDISNAYRGLTVAFFPDCRIVFIHIIGVFFGHFFKMKTKPFYGSKNVCLYVCTEQKLLFYSFFFLFWMLYIMKSFRFGILRSPLRSVFLYLQTLRKKEKNKTTKNKMIMKPFFSVFFLLPQKRFSVTLYFCSLPFTLWNLSSSSCFVDVYFITFYY